MSGSPAICWDLIVTMDDATSEHYSMFLCDEEGTNSSLRSAAPIALYAAR